MRKLILKSFFLLIMTLISLYTITFFIDSGLRQTNHPTWKAWNDILTRKSECEIYIQGSSRAWVQVSPLIIENYTGKKTYNFGIDGHHIDVQLGRYYLYRKYNKKPKIIIQILEGFSLEKRTDLYMKEQFLPYYNEECVVNSIKTMKGFNNIGHKLSFLKYIGETNTSIIGVLEKINIRHYKPVGYKGYLSWDRTWGNEFTNFVKNNVNGVTYKINKQIQNDFEKFINESSKEGIQIILIYAPEYYEFNKYFNNKAEIINRYIEVSRKYNIRFYDFSNSYLSKDKKYFYNSQHLNKYGSELFTKEVVKILEQDTI